MATISTRINNAILAPQDIVSSLASREGPVDIYCWYEGTRGLPASGASFYKKFLFDPLVQQKQDLTIHLYSLKGWDFAKSASYRSDTPLGKAINSCNLAAIRCLYSFAFFQYCRTLPKESPLRRWIDEELPQKQWLADLSAGYKPQGKCVADLFENQPSVFDAIRDLDVIKAYSYMQYIEGYYLIREVVAKSLAEGTRRIQIAFVLPNNEGEYYRDLPQDLEPMLVADFGWALDGLDIDVSFFFFEYGKTLGARPYIDRSKDARYVEPEEIPFYLPPSAETNLNARACS